MPPTELETNLNLIGGSGSAPSKHSTEASCTHGLALTATSYNSGLLRQKGPNSREVGILRNLLGRHGRQDNMRGHVCREVNGVLRDDGLGLLHHVVLARVRC